MAFLECNDVIKLYIDPDSGIQVPALRGVELTAKEGELISIIGPSGSGKSTLINLIGGIDFPSSGTIEVGGRMINKMKPTELTEYRRNSVGFLYQLPERNLLWNVSAFQNVLLPMKTTSKLTRSERKKRALELLSDVGVRERAHHKTHELSGGEAQRVGLAIALANDPSLILADEPTGELDSVTTFKIIDYIRSINQEYGKTIIIVTHDNRFARVTDRALRIEDGRISGLHRARSKKKIYEREEIVFVDSQGNLRIPEDVRKKVGIRSHVTLEAREGYAAILPAED